MGNIKKFNKFVNEEIKEIMKKKFNLSAMVTISIYTEVEADSLEEAIEIARERSIEGYKWGEKDQESRSWVSDSYDGEPFDIEEV